MSTLPDRKPERQEGAPDSFMGMLKERWQAGHFVCVGLDSQFDKIPEVVKSKVSTEEAIYRFNKEIVDATHDLVCAYKPQYAFYGALGEAGITALRRTVAYIHETCPGIPVLLDAKRNDIGNTAEQYAVEVFDTYGVDAVTVNPYLGFDGVEPFLRRKNKGAIILCRTSNPSAREFQDLLVNHSDLGEVPLYQAVAHQIATKWNANENCGLVVGATYPQESVEVRRIAPDLPFLIPGIGAQSGSVEEAVTASQDSRGEGMIINSSRGIIFASSGADFAEAARTETSRLREMINQYR